MLLPLGPGFLARWDSQASQPSPAAGAPREAWQLQRRVGHAEPGGQQDQEPLTAQQPQHHKPLPLLGDLGAPTPV